MIESIAQAAYLKHHHPKVYREFADKTPKGTPLPFKVGPRTARQKKWTHRSIPWQGR
jgi:hypothetical protein